MYNQKETKSEGMKAAKAILEVLIIIAAVLMIGCIVLAFLGGSIAMSDISY